MDILSVITGPLNILILVAGQAGEIQGEITQRLAAIFAEHGGGGVSIDFKEMCHNISLIRTKGLRRFGGQRHVAVDTGDADLLHGAVLKVIRNTGMAGFAGGSDGELRFLMGVVAGHTGDIGRIPVRAGQELVVGLVVADEATFGRNFGLRIAPEMTAAAEGSAIVDGDDRIDNSRRLVGLCRIHMGLCWSVAGFALDAFVDPGAYNALQAILVPICGVAGGVTTTTIVRLDLTGVVVRPGAGQHVVLVVAVPFIGGGYYVTIQTNEAGLPIIPTNHVGDVIPGIAGRQRQRTQLGYPCFAQLIGMARNLEVVVIVGMAF